MMLSTARSTCLNSRQAFARVSTRQFHASIPSAIKVGEPAPGAEIQLKSPGETVTLYDHFKKFNKAILIGVPGAFTPSCTSTHLPSYMKRFEDLKGKGIEEIACISVNDSFVMNAWGESLGTEGKITLLSDPSGTATKALGLDFDIEALGGLRTKRSIIIFKKGVADKVIEEPDNTTLTITHADKVIQSL